MRPDATHARRLTEHASKVRLHEHLVLHVLLQIVDDDRPLLIVLDGNLREPLVPVSAAAAVAKAEAGDEV